jgi:hypothetical protein
MHGNRRISTSTFYVHFPMAKPSALPPSRADNAARAQGAGPFFVSWRENVLRD